MTSMSRLGVCRLSRFVSTANVRSVALLRTFHTPASVDELRTTIESNLKTAVDRTKGTIFGLMANNMSEGDMEKFVKHWGKRIDLHPAEQAPKDPATPVAKIPAKNATTMSAADKSLEKIAYASKKDLVLYHPLLGELVADLGYKRVYLTSVNALARTPVWERQRILRPERASLIADDKIRKGMKHALPGVITMFQLDAGDDIGIVDGQHRAGALMILAQRGYWDEYAKNIAVEVFSVSSEAQISTLFREINAAEPVRLIDLPEETPADTVVPLQEGKGEAGVQQMTAEECQEDHELRQEEAASNNERVIVTQAVESLRQKFPEMFKPTSRCKLPHLNIDVLRDDLFHSGLLRSRSITSAAQLEQVLVDINKEREKKYLAMVSSPKKKKALSKSMQNAVAKAIDQSFFLGMDKEWLFTSAAVDSDK